MLQVFVPPIHTDLVGFQSLAKIAEQISVMRFNPVELNFEGCGFFDANITTVLSVILDIHGACCSVINVQDAVEMALRRNDFLSRFGFVTVEDQHGTSYPLRRFESGDYDGFVLYINNLFSDVRLPRMSNALKHRFKSSLLEMFLNAVEHAQSLTDIYCCAQYYSATDKLRFTISDGGIGVRRNVVEYIGQNISSCEAIHWAMQEFNTTKSGNRPGGMGLKLIKDFVGLNQGELLVVSGDGFYDLKGIDEKSYSLQNPLPGTTISLEIDTRDSKEYILSSEISSGDIF